MRAMANKQKPKDITVTAFPPQKLNQLVKLAEQRGIGGGDAGAIRWAAISWLHQLLDRK